jgi:hypothetical protein
MSHEGCFHSLYKMLVWYGHAAQLSSNKPLSSHLMLAIVGSSIWKKFMKGMNTLLLLWAMMVVLPWSLQTCVRSSWMIKGRSKDLPLSSKILWISNVEAPRTSEGFFVTVKSQFLNAKIHNSPFELVTIRFSETMICIVVTTHDLAQLCSHDFWLCSLHRHRLWILVIFGSHIPTKRSHKMSILIYPQPSFPIFIMPESPKVEMYHSLIVIIRDFWNFPPPNTWISATLTITIIVYQF